MRYVCHKVTVSATHRNFHLERAGDEPLNLAQLTFPQVNGDQ